MTKRIPISYIKTLIRYLEDRRLLGKISSAQQFYDDPKPYIFVSTLNHPKKLTDGVFYKSSSSGLSFMSKYEAIFKCLVEAYERLGQVCFRYIELINDTPNSLRGDCLDIVRYFGVHQNKKIFWTEGYDITNDKKCLIPAQLVYLNYERQAEEMLLYQSNSTGAAIGLDLESAVVNGIYEVVERDAFITTYLTKSAARKIDIVDLVTKLTPENKKTLKAILENIEFLNLELMLFDMTTDLKIPTFMSFLMDKTGIGPALTVGSKSSLNQQEAVIGAIEESFQTRSWLRYEMGKNKFKNKISPKNISSFLQRGLLWASLKNLRVFDYLTGQKAAGIKPLNIRYFNKKEELKTLIRIFQKRKIELFYKDISLDFFLELSLVAVKVLIPHLHPLPLDERAKKLNYKRLEEVRSHFGNKNQIITTFPHPFL